VGADRATRNRVILESWRFRGVRCEAKRIDSCTIRSTSATAFEPCTTELTSCHGGSATAGELKGNASPYAEKDVVHRSFVGKLRKRMQVKGVIWAVFALALIVSGCVSTEFYSWQGSAVMIGTGGAAKNVNGVEIWMTGSPPRKFRVIGYIEDSRPNRGIPLLTRYPDIAKAAKAQGGDGVLIQSESVQYMGTVTGGNAFTHLNGNVYGNGFYGNAFSSSTAISAPLTQREDRYYVIKYL
jgi:hypothetical protein